MGESIDRPFELLPGRSTFVLHGHASARLLGWWSDDGSSPGLVGPADVTPCPVCGVLGGFHDDARHAAREVPRHLQRRYANRVLPYLRKAEPAERPRLTDDEIAERREAARLRREART